MGINTKFSNWRVPIALILIFVLATGIIPMHLSANDEVSGDFDITSQGVWYTPNGENEQEWNDTISLNNKDKLRYQVYISPGGSGATDVNVESATFTLKVSKIFLAVSDEFKIPTFTAEKPGYIDPLPLFELKETNEEEKYFEFTYKYSEEYIKFIKEDFVVGSDDYFANALMEVILTLEITQENKEFTTEIIFDTEIGITPPITIPEDDFTIRATKALDYKVYKNADGKWVKSASKANNKILVSPNDIVPFTIEVKNNGNVKLNKIKILESLGAGYKLIDKTLIDETDSTGKTLKDILLQFDWPNMGTPHRTEEAIESSFNWTEVEGQPNIYTYEQEELGVGESIYLLMIAQVKELENNKSWTDDELKNSITATKEEDDVESKSTIGTTMVPDLKEENYDVAIATAIGGVVKEDGYLYSDSDLHIASKPFETIKAQAGEIALIGIKVRNQSSRKVQIKSIAQYMPIGFEMIEGYKETLYPFNKIGDKNYEFEVDNTIWETDGILQVPTEIHPDAKKIEGLNAVTTYIWEPNNLVIEANGTYRTNIAVRIKDLDQILLSQGIITDLNDKDDVMAARTKALRLHGRDYILNAIKEYTSEVSWSSRTYYDVYTTAAEVVEFRRFNENGQVNDVKEVDIDSFNDNDPFDELLRMFKNGVGYKAETSNHQDGKYITEWINGVPQVSTGLGTSSDEDDYDYTSLSVTAPDYYNYPTLIKTYVGKGDETNYPALYGKDNSGNYVIEIERNGNNAILGNPTDENSRQLAVKSAFPSDSAKKYTQVMPENVSGMIQFDLKNINDAFTYRVNINATGMKDLKNVKFTDTLPDGLKILKDDNGDPVVMVREIIAVGDKQMTLDPENSTYNPIEFRPSVNDTRYVKRAVIKDFASNVFHSNLYNEPKANIQGTGVQPLGEMIIPKIPCTGSAEISDPDYWKSIIKVIDDDKTLTMNLGDIGTRGFEITFYVYVDEMVTGNIKNKAMLSSTDVNAESEMVYVFKWDPSAMSSFYMKNIVDLDAPKFDSSNPTSLDDNPVEIVNKQDATDFSIRYRIRVRSNIEKTPNSSSGFKAGTINLVDEIKNFGGIINVKDIEVKSFKVTLNNDETTLSELTASDLDFNANGIKNEDVTYDGTNLKITNGNKMPLNRHYYIYFTVDYKNIPDGTAVRNIVGGSTTTATTPVKIDLVKVDSADNTIKLSGVKFKAYYSKVDDGKTVADTTKPVEILDITTKNPISNSEITTNANGEAKFLFNPSIEEYTKNKEWKIILMETQTASTEYDDNKEEFIITIVKESSTGNLIVKDVVKGTPVMLKNTKRLDLDGKIILKKLDNNDGTTMLAGAEFKLYKHSEYVVNKTTATIIDTITTSNNESEILLKEGKYVLVETKAPTGYNLNGVEYVIEVTNLGKVTITYLDTKYDVETNWIQVTPTVKTNAADNNASATLNIYNSNRIKIIKTDQDDARLNGAKFSIWIGDTIGLPQDVHKTVTSAKIDNVDGIVWLDLTQGTYTMKETVAPAGYGVSDTVYKIVVDSKGAIKIDNVSKTELTITNKQIYILLDKQTLGNTKLAGAEFSYYNFNEYVANKNTAVAIGTLTTTNIGSDKIYLNAGKYILVETKAPDGYLLNPIEYVINVSENGKTEITYHDTKFENAINWDIAKQSTIENAITANDISKIIVFNETNTEIPGTLKFQKLDNNTKAMLAGAVFEIYNADSYNLGKENPLYIPEKTITTTNAEQSIELTTGEYVLVETKAPEGYELSNAKYEISVTLKGIVTVTATEDTGITPAVIVNGTKAAPTASLKVYNKNQIKLTKTGENNEKLDGVKFKITKDNAEGILVKEIITATINAGEANEEVGVVYFDLAEGTYFVTETVTNEGYALNGVSYKIVVDNKGVIKITDELKTEITVNNKKIYMELEKLANEIGNEKLADAQFKLYDYDKYIADNKEVLDTIISSSTQKVKFAINVGKYILVETAPPTGYLITPVKYVIEVKNNGSVTISYHGTPNWNVSGTAVKESAIINANDVEQTASLTVYNAKISGKTGEIILHKLDNNNGALIAGATFKLFDAEEYETNGINGTELQEFDTEAATKKIVLLKGNYVLVETKAPVGYELNDVIYEISVNNEGIVEITIKGTPSWSGVKESIISSSFTEKSELKIYNKNQFKVIKESLISERLDGAIFSLWKDEIGDNGSLIHDSITTKTITTNGIEVKGIVYIENLLAGTYFLVETKAPEGYALSGQQYKIVVAENGVITIENNTVSEAIFKNKPIFIELNKYDNEDKELRIAGVEFKIYPHATYVTAKENGTQLPLAVKEITTKDDASNKISLSPGKYILVETKAKNGYVINPVEYVIDIANDGKITLSYLDIKYDEAVNWLIADKTLVTEATTDAQHMSTLDIYNSTTKVENNLYLEKYNLADKDKMISGAEFTLFKMNDLGEKTDEGTLLVPSATVAALTRLDVGTYRLEETKTPVDYDQMPENSYYLIVVQEDTNEDGNKYLKITITLEGTTNETLVPLITESNVIINGKTVRVYTLKAYNKATVYLGNVNVIKVNEKQEKLAGAIFTIYNIDGEVVSSATTNSNGVFAKNIELLPGTYTMKETSAPSGYDEINTVYNIIVSKHGETTINGLVSFPEIQNKKSTTPPPTDRNGEIRLKKVDAVDPEKILAGVEFTLYRGETVITTYRTDANGEITMVLSPGEYILKETVALDGYVLSTSKYTINVDSGGNTKINGRETSEIRIINYKSTGGPGELIVIKRGDDGNNLANAVFEITDTNGELVSRKTTPSNGELRFNLSDGKYTLKETYAPEGYELVTATYSIEVLGGIVKINDRTQNSIVVINNKITTSDIPQPPTGTVTPTPTPDEFISVDDGRNPQGGINVNDEKIEEPEEEVTIDGSVPTGKINPKTGDNRFNPVWLITLLTAVVLLVYPIFKKETDK